MLGWWEDTEQGNGTVPVASSNPSLKVTVYLKKGAKALIVLADWDELSRDVSCTLTYDWDALGLDQASASLSAPLLPPFREPWPPSVAAAAGASCLTRTVGCRARAGGYSVHVRPNHRCERDEWGVGVAARVNTSVWQR